MSCRNQLDQITRCAGDTTPLRVYLMKADGSHYASTELSSITGTLTLTPHIAGTASSPSLTISGTYGADEAGYATMTFSFTRSSTISLSGQYVYQVEMKHNNSASEVRVSQGFLTIMPNNNP